MRPYRAALAVAFLAAALVTLRVSPVGHLAGWERVMLWQFRLPRLAMAAMLGSGMALSGWAAQKSTRNALASPDMLTVPAAASLGVMLVLSLSDGLLLSSRALPFAAAGSGALSAALLFACAGRRRQLEGSGLLLVGIALGSLLTAASFLIALNSHPSTYQYAIAFLSGSLARASWDYVWMLLPAWWLLTLAIVSTARRMDVLMFEDHIVTGLGGRADRWRRFGLCLSAALGAACVGAGGNLVFLGFVAPHIVRGATGNALESPWTVCVTGAVLLLASDAIGQIVVRPGEVPAGIVIAVVGAPCFFVALLRRKVVA